MRHHCIFFASWYSQISAIRACKFGMTITAHGLYSPRPGATFSPPLVHFTTATSCWQREPAFGGIVPILRRWSRHFIFRWFTRHPACSHFVESGFLVRVFDICCALSSIFVHCSNPSAQRAPLHTCCAHSSPHLSPFSAPLRTFRYFSFHRQIWAHLPAFSTS